LIRTTETKAGETFSMIFGICSIYLYYILTGVFGKLFDTHPAV